MPQIDHPVALCNDRGAAQKLVKMGNKDEVRGKCVEHTVKPTEPGQESLPILLHKLVPCFSASWEGQGRMYIHLRRRCHFLILGHHSCQFFKKNLH